jgi:hypothetical protein
VSKRLLCHHDQTLDDCWLIEFHQLLQNLPASEDPLDGWDGLEIYSELVWKMPPEKDIFAREV